MIQHAIAEMGTTGKIQKSYTITETTEVTETEEECPTCGTRCRAVHTSTTKVDTRRLPIISEGGAETKYEPVRFNDAFSRPRIKGAINT